jgi:predicted ATP-grasp superfamily ATP-dependent carboligase
VKVLLVGPWTPASLAFARSLRRRGIGTYLLQTGTGEYCAPRTLSVVEGASTMPLTALGTEAGIALIRTHVERVRALAVAALTDSELLWLAENRNQFSPPCQVLVQAPELLAKLLSKHYQMELAREAGLTVLPTYRLTKPDDANAIPAADFPLVLRPDRAGSVEPHFKVRLVDSVESLWTVIRECQRLDGPILAQPYMRLPNLVVHGARSTSGHVIASRCYDVPRKFEGVSLVIQPRAFPGRLEDMCREFVTRADIHGCYHLEFLFSPSDSRAYFLEANVRLGGTTDKVVRTGFDEPALLLESFGVIPKGTSRATPTARRVVNKRVVVKHIARAAVGHLTAFDHPKANRLAHIAYSCRDLLLAKDSIFDWRDVSGSLRFHLRDVITRRSREKR